MIGRRSQVGGRDAVAIPGHGPVLEPPVYFGDLYDGLIYNIQAPLQRVLPLPYYASKSDRVWVEEDQRRTVEPGVNVLRGEDGADEPPSRVISGTAVAEPVVVPVVHDGSGELTSTSHPRA